MGLSDIGCTLPPGFRFYPSDEELVCHYLHKKIANEEADLRGTLVEIDLHICEPWQLPGTKPFSFFLSVFSLSFHLKFLWWLFFFFIFCFTYNERLIIFYGDHAFYLAHSRSLIMDFMYLKYLSYISFWGLI